MLANVTTRGKSFLAAGIVLIVAGLALGVRDLTRVGTLATLLPLLTSLLARRQHVDGLRIDRVATPPRLRPDEPATVTLTLTNTGSRRTPLIMAEERLDYCLGDRPRFVVAPIRPGESRIMRYTIRSAARGRHQIGPMGIGVRDAFGLTTRTAAHSTASDVLVLPRTHLLSSGKPRGAELGAEGSIPHRVSAHGDEDSSIRDYRDGDDLRRIHWPATARTGTLMVRQEDRPARRRAILLLDTRAEIHQSRGPASSLEWATSATASIALHLLDAGYAVHVVTGDADHIDDDLNAEELLDQMAEVTASTSSEWVTALHTASTLGATGGMVVAVVGPMDETMALSLATVRSSGSNGLAIVVADSRGADGPAPEVAAQATAAVLRGAGWSAISATTDREVPRVWDEVSGAQTVRVAR